MLVGHKTNKGEESDYYDQWDRIFKFYEKHFNPKEKEEKDKEVETDQGN